MTVTEDMLIAWLDGELDEEAAKSVEAAVAADPALAATAERHRALAERVRSAFGPIVEEPVPEALAARVRPPQDKVIDLATRRDRLVRWQAWGALAACLGVGMIVGLNLPQGASVLGAGMAAKGELASLLETKSSATRGAIGLTFRDRDGRYCRTFALDSVSGLACREDGDWRVELAVRQPKAAETEYRTAASVTAPPVLNMVDALIEGDPLDAEQEAAALASKWSK